MTVALSTVSSALMCSHRVRRAGAADHEELVAAGVLDRGQHADALVVVVVPERVDLRRGLQQVGRRLLAGLDGELGGDPVARPSRPQSSSASSKPWLRSWVSGRESMPAISAMTASVMPLSLSCSQM